jgi:hypothetical protein
MADLDGDGFADRATMFAALNGRGHPLSWHLLVDRARGAAVIRTIHPTNRKDRPGLIGATDVNGDGVPELFVRLGVTLYHSGGTTNVGIFTMLHKAMTAVKLPGGVPLVTSVGGLSMFGQGIGCVGPAGPHERLALLRIDNVASKRPQWSAHYFRVSGAQMRPVGSRSGSFKRHGYLDPRINRFYDIRCGSLMVGFR